MWCLAGSQAVDQLICCCGPGSRRACGSPLGLSRALQPIHLLWVFFEQGLWGRFGPESRGPRVRSIWPVGEAASLCSWCAPTQGFRCGRTAGVSGVGPQSANLGALNWASGESLVCLSCIHSPGAEGVRVQEATAAAESCLTSR